MKELAYEAPALTEIGALHELTLQDTKDRTGADGEIFENAPLGEVS
jgi:hypothetical protein